MALAPGDAASDDGDESNTKSGSNAAADNLATSSALVSPDAPATEEQVIKRPPFLPSSDEEVVLSRPSFSPSALEF